MTTTAGDLTSSEKSMESKDESKTDQKSPPPLHPPNIVSTDVSDDTAKVVSKDTTEVSPTSPDAFPTDGSNDVPVAAKPETKDKQPPPAVKRYNSFSTAVSGQHRYSMSETVAGKADIQFPERYEGQLHRKHEMENATKKASNR